MVAFTSRPDVYRRLALYWGVEPVIAPPSGNFDEMLSKVTGALRARKVCKEGDLVVIVVAVPFGAGLSANTLHIHRV